MEITESTIYWITRLDDLKQVSALMFLFAIITTLVLGFITGCVHSDYEGDERKRYKKLLARLYFIPIVLFIFASTHPFIPTTKEMCAIKVLPLVMNDDTVQEIPSDIAELAHKWLEELKPKKD